MGTALSGLILFGGPVEKVGAPEKPLVKVCGRRVFECRSSCEAAHVKVYRILLQPRLVAPVSREPTGAFEKKPARSIFYAQDSNPHSLPKQTLHFAFNSSPGRFIPFALPFKGSGLISCFQLVFRQKM
jgi:hypothetical protein